MAKNYKTHKEIPAKYKWDLKFLLGGKTIEQNIKESIKFGKDYIAMKESKYESKEKFLKAQKLSQKWTLKNLSISNYLSNSSSLDVTDSKIQSLTADYSFKLNKLAQEEGATGPLFFKNATKLAKWAKLPEFAEYKYEIESRLETKKHQLPKAIQEYEVKTSRGEISASGPFSILTNSELVFKDAVDSKGKKHKLNASLRQVYAMSDDKILRKTSSENFQNAYVQHKGTLSNLLFQQFKAWTVDAEVTKHSSPTNYLTFDDRVNDEFLEVLYSSVQSNVPNMAKKRKYWDKFYKSKFGEKPTKYDYSRKLISSKSTKYSADDAMKLVTESVKPFGKEYTDEVKRAFKERWVDFYPLPNKRGGAYSIGGTYGIDKKLILMNFNDTYNSVNTLAHEMGHSMHSYYSDKYNKFTNSFYPIFVAEIASIFNEQMFADYMIKNAKTNKEKFAILSELIQGFEGTVLRQTEWSNYEFEMLHRIAKGEPLNNYDAITKLYYENHAKYAVSKPKPYKPEENFAAIYVPHFYMGFYVYKYAIGQLVTNVFFNRYKLGGKVELQKYINDFLKAGVYSSPVETLKKAGIDLKDPTIYEEGFATYNKWLEEWIQLGKKIFKVK